MWWLSLWLLGCNGDDGDGGPKPTGDSGLTVEDCDSSPLRYDTFAQPLLATWCTPCHSSSLAGEERSGAPEGLDFDSYDNVVALGAQIASSIRDERMPPVGGLSPEERADFSAWVDCGAPEGAPLTTTPQMCEAPVAVAPEAVDCTDPTQSAGVAVDATYAPAGGELDCVCAVEGDLRPLADSTLANLVRVSGHVDLVDAAQIHLPALQEVGGLSVRGPTVNDLLLDGLEVVNGSVELTGTALSRFDLPRLSHVDGDILVTDNALLERGAQFGSTLELGGSFRFVDNDAFEALVLFGHLDTFAGDIEVRDNDQLVSVVGLTVLERLEGRLTIQENPLLEVVNVGIALTTIDHGLVLLGNGELANVETFPALRSVGMSGTPDGTDPGATDVYLVANTNLEAFTAIPGVQALGGYRVGSHIRLEVLGPMPDLATVAGDFVVENTRSVKEPPSVESLTDIGGSLLITTNRDLDTLSPLASITSVSGDLAIVDNEALSTSFAEGFAAAITVGGTTFVSGNGP